MHTITVQEQDPEGKVWTGNLLAYDIPMLFLGLELPVRIMMVACFCPKGQTGREQRYISRNNPLASFEVVKTPCSTVTYH